MRPWLTAAAAKMLERVGWLSIELRPIRNALSVPWEVCGVMGALLSPTMQNDAVT